MRSIVIEACKKVCPCDSDALFNAVLLATSEDTKLIKNIQATVNALPNNSIQSDVLLATIVKTYDAVTVKEKFNIGKVKLASLRQKFNRMSSELLIQPTVRSVQQLQKT
jgi:hypothetical protein